MDCGVAMKDIKKPGIAKNEAGFGYAVSSLAVFVKRPQAEANQRMVFIMPNPEPAWRTRQ